MPGVRAYSNNVHCSHSAVSPCPRDRAPRASTQRGGYGCNGYAEGDVSTGRKRRLVSDKTMLTNNNLLSETAGISVDNDVSCLVWCSHGLGSGAENTRERVAISPNEKQLENGNDDCRGHRGGFGRHQNVEDPNVYY